MSVLKLNQIQTASGVIMANLNSSGANAGIQLASNLAPAFRATKSSQQTISNNTLTKVTFDTETFDTNNNFDSTTNYRFTPTIAGYYQVNYSYSALSLTTARAYAITALIYKNGSSYTQFEHNITSAADQWGSILTALVYCNGSTDYIEAYIYQNNSPAGTINISGSSATTQFSASMVRSS